MSPPTAGLASFAPRRRRHSRRDSTVKHIEGEEDTADTDEDTRIGRSCYLGDAHSSGRVLDLPQARGHGAVEATVVLGKSHPTRDDEDYYYLKGDVRKFRGRFLNGSIASAPSASTSEVSLFHLRMGN